MNMSVETGVVESIENSWAHVLTQRKGSCEGCSHKGHCHIIPGMDKVMEIRQELTPVVFRILRSTKTPS